MNLLLICVYVLLHNCAIEITAKSLISARLDLSNDFEDGKYSPWYDDSPGNVDWFIEDFNSPSEANYPAPKPANGSKYLRARRNSLLDSGLAVLRSEILTATPGDRVTFNYWIRSTRTQGNSLELTMTVNRTETVLLSLTEYSTINNFEWTSANVLIPVEESTDVTLVFYGYCGSNNEDAIGIDDTIIDKSIPPSTTEGSTTTSISTTVELSTTTPDSNVTSTTISSSVCSNDLTTSTGSVTSPNYPSNYLDYYNDCTTIQVQSGSKISITFTDFVTEPSYDVVSIYDGLLETSEKLLLNASGYDLPVSVVTTSNSCLIRFFTDGAYNFKGWRLDYISV